MEVLVDKYPSSYEVINFVVKEVPMTMRQWRFIVVEKDGNIRSWIVHEGRSTTNILNIFFKNYLKAETDRLMFFIIFFLRSACY